jgi:hypothetical protein
MLHIQDVPKFEFILIHCGNTDEDTEGCLLVGSQALTEPGDMRVTQSVAAYQRLYQRVLSAALGGNLSISFEDNDRAQHAAVSEAVTAVGDSRNRGDTVEISKSDKWEVTNLAHRFTTSFFKSQYGDRPESVSGRPDFSNRELLYFNEASADQTTSATICAGLLVTYMEAQGIPYHRDKTRKLCFDMLQPHLANGEGTVLHTADIIDHHFRFMNEVSIDG